MTVSQGAQSAATPDSPLTVFRVGLALAVLHLGVLVVRPEPTLPELAAVEGLVCLGLVAVEFRKTRSPAQAVGLGLTAGALLAGLWLALELGGALWQVTLLFAGAAALLVYGVHRYQLVALGRVEGSDES